MMIRSNSKRPWFVFAGCLALAAVSFGAWAGADEEKPAYEAEPLPAGIAVKDAQVTLIEQVVVPAEDAGVIETSLVKEGDLVKQGDLLARISDAEAQLERRKAQLEMEIAALKAKNDVSIRYARKSSEVLAAELKRSEEAVERVKSAVSQTELDRQRLSVQKAELEIEQAQRDLDEQGLNHQLKVNEYALATRAVERRQIRSPIAGKIVEVSKHGGEWVEPGNQVFRIVRIDRLRVKGYVNLSQLVGELEGRPVTLVIEFADRPRPQLKFPGKLVFVSPEVNEVNGEQVEVWAEVDNKAMQLRPGMHGTLVIHNPTTTAAK